VDHCPSHSFAYQVPQRAARGHRLDLPGSGSRGRCWAPKCIDPNRLGPPVGLMMDFPKVGKLAIALRSPPQCKGGSHRIKRQSQAVRASGFQGEQETSNRGNKGFPSVYRVPFARSSSHHSWICLGRMGAGDQNSPLPAHECG
jgi:hypothetical protein